MKAYMLLAPAAGLLLVSANPPPSQSGPNDEMSSVLAADAPAPAVAPAPAPAPHAVAAAYPRCSATVTDRCIQGRGAPRPRAVAATPRRQLALRSGERG